MKLRAPQPSPRKRHVRPLILLSVAVIVLLLGVAGFGFNRFFTVQNVSCQVSDQACPDYVMAELHTLQGRSMFFGSFQQLGQKISTYAPSLQNMQVTRKLPHSIEYHFTWAKPAYMLKIGVSDQVWVIDEVGMSISDQLDPSLPTLVLTPELAQTMSLGGQLPAGLHPGIQALLAALQTKNLPVVQMRIVTLDEFELELVDGVQVIAKVSEAASAIEKLSILLTRMDFATIKPPVKVIDLRFQNPVLRTTRLSSDLAPMKNSSTQ